MVKCKNCGETMEMDCVEETEWQMKVDYVCVCGKKAQGWHAIEDEPSPLFWDDGSED